MMVDRKDVTLDRAVYEAWNLVKMGVNAFARKAQVLGEDGIVRQIRPTDALPSLGDAMEWLELALTMAPAKEPEAITLPDQLAAAQIEIEYLRDLLRNIYLFLCWPGDSFPKQTANFHREVLEDEPWWKKEETDAL